VNNVLNATVNSLDNSAARSGDGVLFAAVCDLRSVIDKGGITVDAATVAAVTETLVAGYESLLPDTHAQWTVMSMGRLQGLCPRETWNNWQRLNGC